MSLEAGFVLKNGFDACSSCGTLYSNEAQTAKRPSVELCGKASREQGIGGSEFPC